VLFSILNQISPFVGRADEQAWRIPSGVAARSAERVSCFRNVSDRLASGGIGSFADARIYKNQKNLRKKPHLRPKPLVRAG